MTAYGPLRRSAGSSPRIEPGGREQIGALNLGIARLVDRAARGGPTNLLITLGRHRGLFRPWLRFAAALMRSGRLRRKDTELLILRVAHNCRSEYEWAHHERLALAVGLTKQEIDRARAGPEADGWSEDQAALIRAADELHADRTLSSEAWNALRSRLSEEQLIELCLLVGHYEMLAMTINSLGIQPDAPAGPPPRVIRLLRAAARRRQSR
jgi:alkylhydroperoxidase family enzyme